MNVDDGYQYPSSTSLNMPQETFQTLLTLFLAILIVIGFLFFHCGKQITESLSSIFYAYRYIQPSPTYPTSPTAPISPTAPTAPIGPTGPTAPSQPVEVEIIPSNGYQIQSNPGETVIISFSLKNPSLETIHLNHLILGNKENNNFLQYIEKETFTIQYIDPKGITQTSLLKDTGTNALNGYRIFYLSPALILSSQTTREFKISLTLKEEIPLKDLKLELTNIYGYAYPSKTLVKSKGILSVTIIIFPTIRVKNLKNHLKYSPKEVFLISDKNWKDVLSLVPLTTWTDGNGTIHKYPTLIFHQELAGFDADSIIYFMQQYHTEMVTWIGDIPYDLYKLLFTSPGLGVGLDKGQFKKISVDDYLSYWQEYQNVVYVEDNYELSLMASTYASLINAPLIIKGTSLDSPNVFRHRNVICVGNITPQGAGCSQRYNLAQLQRAYLERTRTDKIILVNPDDLNIKVTARFIPEKSAQPINELYSRTSLAAPILASGKHELITFVHQMGSSPAWYDYKQIDQEFTNQFLNLYNFKQSDFEAKECKTGDTCSEGIDTYNLPVEESIEDSVSYKFDIDDLNLETFRAANFLYLETEETCFKKAEPKYIININGQEYRDFGDYALTKEDKMLEGYVHLSLLYYDDRVEGLSEIPVEDGILNVTIQIPGCKIIRKLDQDNKILELIKEVPGGFLSYSKFEPFETTNLIERIIGVKGIKAGQQAYFNFSNLNNKLDYRILLNFPGTREGTILWKGITHEEFKKTFTCKEPFIMSECTGPYFNDKEVSIIKKNEIINGEATVMVRSNAELSNEILILSSVSLIPLLPKDYYLTIISSPDAIQMSSAARIVLDFYYSTLDRNYYLYGEGPSMHEYSYFTKLLTGRIFGFSLSDVSSYLARDLFFNEIKKDKSASFIFQGSLVDKSAEDIKHLYMTDISWGEDGSNIYTKFPDGVYACYSYHDEEVGCDTHREETKNSYYNSYFTFYSGHGTYFAAFVSSYDLYNRYLQPKTNVIEACATCDFVWAKNAKDNKNLFCMQNLRRGSLGYIGAQSITTLMFGSSDVLIPMIVLEKQTIAKAFHLLIDIRERGGWENRYVLIGDPTLFPIYW